MATRKELEGRIKAGAFDIANAEKSPYKNEPVQKRQLEQMKSTQEENKKELGRPSMSRKWTE